jgi:hypothetical protein
MLWVVFWPPGKHECNDPNGTYEHIDLTGIQRMDAFHRLRANCELSEVFYPFCKSVGDRGRFAKYWISRWSGLQLYILHDDPPAGSLDVTVVFMAYFLSNRLSSAAQPNKICELLAEKAFYSEVEADTAIDLTFKQATTLLCSNVTEAHVSKKPKTAKHDQDAL